MTLPFPDSPSMDENIVDSIQRIEQNIEYLDENLTTGTSRLNSSTRDLTAATGNVTYTVTGITPKSVICFAVEPTTSASSFGFIDENGTEYCIYRNYDGDWAADTAAAIRLETASGAYQAATYSSFASGSFVLTWTKTNAPTGTAYLIFLALS